MQNIIIAIRELHKLLKVNKEFKKPDEELWSYDVAHHAGMSLQEEYELLELILFRAIPRHDVKPLARLLLDTFGDINRVVTAPAAHSNYG